MRTICRFILVAFFTLSASLDGFAANDFSSKIDKMITELSGVIKASPNGVMMADIPSAVEGMDFIVFRYGKEILHPITNANLGKQKIDVTRTTIRKDGTVVCSKNDNITSGDGIEIIRPIVVSLKFEKNIKAIDQSSISSQLLRGKQFKIVEDESSYEILCSGLDNKSVACELKYNGTPLLKDYLSSSDFKLTRPIDNNSLVPTGSLINIERAINVDKDMTSITSGYVYGRDKGPSVLLADTNNVYIYPYSDNATLENPVMIGDKLNSIVSIDALDLDGDGVDEIFVSDLIEKPEHTIVSSIYKYDGEKFNLIAFELPYAFRTYFADGKKSLVAQEYVSAEFSGTIKRFQYADGKYQMGAAIENSLGLKLFGFGIGSSGELVTINSSGSFTITDKGKHYESKNTAFADNNKYIFYKKEKIVGTKTAMNGNITNMTESSMVAIPIMQRIIEIRDNVYLLSINNVLGNSLEKVNKFTSASLGFYSMIGDSLSQLFLVKYDKPAILESDILRMTDGSEYILTLVNLNENRYKVSVKARVTVFKITPE